MNTLLSTVPSPRACSCLNAAHFTARRYKEHALHGLIIKEKKKHFIDKEKIQSSALMLPILLIL